MTDEDLWRTPLVVHCEHCGAAAGQPCLYRGRRQDGKFHGDRTRRHRVSLRVRAALQQRRSA